MNETEKKNSIILIGFMGTGKTSLGKAVSKKLQIPFLDTDRLITEKEGMSINDIFASKGEDWFRNLETQTLRGLCSKEGRYVISAGGGLPLREENRLLLKKLGYVIYLKTGTDILAERLQRDQKRPVLRQGEGTLREKIERILKEREPVYLDAADRVIVNNGRPFSRMVSEIVSAAAINM